MLLVPCLTPGSGFLGMPTAASEAQWGVHQLASSSTISTLWIPHT